MLTVIGRHKLSGRSICRVFPLQRTKRILPAGYILLSAGNTGECSGPKYLDSRISRSKSFSSLSALTGVENFQHIKVVLFGSCLAILAKQVLVGLVLFRGHVVVRLIGRSDFVGNISPGCEPLTYVLRRVVQLSEAGLHGC